MSGHCNKCKRHSRISNSTDREISNCGYCYSLKFPCHIQGLLNKAQYGSRIIQNQPEDILRRHAKPAECEHHFNVKSETVLHDDLLAKPPCMCIYCAPVNTVGKSVFNGSHHMKILF